ncbi:MAG: penicillin-binding protein 2 [Candidatus Paceibacterota bacterium]|jgi:penicillin-binding protein 2
MLGFHRSHGYQKFKVKRWNTDIETDDLFLDALTHKKDKNSYTIETALSQRIFQLVLTSFILIIGILFFRCFSFQVFDYKTYNEKAERNKFLSSEIEAQRGIIYDRNFKQLVINTQGFDLVCNLLKLPEDELLREKQVREVARILDMPFEDLNKNIEEMEAAEESEFSLVRDIDKDKVIILKTKEEELTGFEIVKKKSREYLSGYDLAHIIGYVSGDSSTGESGIEKQYNDVLKEIPGEINREKDVHGNLVKEEIIKPSESGNNIVLNIDYDLQKKAAAFLASAVEGYNAKGGAVVAVNPKTGEVLSLISYPSFDNNIFSKDLTTKEFNDLLKNPKVSFYNRATSGEYPTGSTLKPMIAVAALEQGIVTVDKEIYCEGGIELNDDTFKKDWATHGWTSLKKAIAESCDVFFYMIGGGYKNFNGLGIAKIEKYLEKFGFGAKTNIDLPEESVGLVPDPTWKEDRTGTSWYPGDTYNVSIGQGYFKATPLQLTMAISSIANGGKLMKPQVVKSVLDNNNQTIKTFEPEIVSKDFVSLSAIESVREGMRETVLSPAGTARSLQYLPVTSGAKTGTAQTGKNEIYHNWITVFAPYDDPEIVLTIIVESVPKNTGLANLVARETLGYYFGEKEIQQNKEEIINEGGN